MTTKSDFSEEDWIVVATAPVFAAGVISAAEDTGEGTVDEETEATAFRESFDKLRKKFRKSELVLEVLDAMSDEGHEAFKEAWATIDSAVSHENPIESRLEKIGQAADIVERVADRKEAKAFKSLVNDVASIVANAASESFFGSSITKKEAFYLRRISQVVGR